MADPMDKLLKELKKPFTCDYCKWKIPNAKAYEDHLKKKHPNNR